MVTFVVTEHNEAFPPYSGRLIAVLRRDNWDDYTFRTTFTLVLLAGYGETIEIGQVKILQRGQLGGSQTELPSVVFEELSNDYCSLGQSSSYYEALHRLGSGIYRPILRGLRDIVADSTIREEFKDEEGFQTSLERFGSSARAVEDAAHLFASAWLKNPMRRPAKPLALAFLSSVGGSQFLLELKFGDSPDLPSRINVIIGYNGTGKTRLLANLAMVAHADLMQRAKDSFVRSYGSFLDNSARFGAVIAVSYSAFDTFEVPGRTRQERERLEHSGEVFGHVYCGLRSFSSAQAADSNEEPHKLKSISASRLTFDPFLSPSGDGGAATRSLCE